MKAVSMESTDRDLWIVRKHEVVEVRSGSPIDRIVQGTSALDVVVQVADRAPKNAVRLSRGSWVHFEHETASIRPLILASLEPDNDLRDELHDKYVEARTKSSLAQVGPIDTGNAIDGSRWGWIPTDDDPVRFALVPLTGGERSLATLRARMYGNIAGVVVCWGLSMLDEWVATLWYEADKSNLGTSYVRPIYNPFSYGDLLLSLVEDWSADYGTMCPVCDQDGYGQLQSWTVRLTIDPDAFTESEVGTALGRVWHPCTKHLRRRVIQLNDAGRPWIWSNRRWEPDGKPGATS